MQIHHRLSSNPAQQYYVDLPDGFDPGREYPLLVAVHGAQRTARTYARLCREWDTGGRSIVVAPLFEGAYQTLGLGQGERVDLRLLEIVDEVAGRYPVSVDAFALFGYSGGGQFAHRFLYLHPDRLTAVVVGAPGTVTLPLPELEWSGGTGNLQALTGKAFDLATVRTVPKLLLVGEDDVTDDELNQSAAANRFGLTRLERARTLHAAWSAARVDHDYLEIPGLGHHFDETVVDPAMRFLFGPPETNRIGADGWGNAGW